MSRRWKWFLALSLVAGVLLRTLYVQDMEYKEDEEFNFLQTQLQGASAWPWAGMPSGVFLVNPGMSVWVFTALAKIFGIHTPTGLEHAVQAVALLGISLLVPFAVRFVSREKRGVWFWAFSLAMVNPFQILYQRKLWPEPFLPLFMMPLILGWWLRTEFWGAFIWGLAGALVGQVHMSGFFVAGAIFLWTLCFGKKLKPEPKGTHWRGWLLGSVVGALPLVPWALYAIQHPPAERVISHWPNWNEAFQLKFWVFWITNPLGLHLGNPLGLIRGGSTWAQLSDFVRYPVVAGQATYGVGMAHILALGASLGILIPGTIRSTFGLFKRTQNSAPTSPEQFLRNAAFWGAGILLTATTVSIRRYYLMIAFPLDFVWLILLAQKAWPRHPKRPVRLLTALWIAQLAMSAGFVHYVHVNRGSLWGDYGNAYHVVIEERAASAARH